MKDNAYIKRLLEHIAWQQSREAYKELFMLLHRPLCQFAAGILKSEFDAEEVVSDVFIQVWEKRQTLDQVEWPRLYFYTAVRNRALNLLARQKRQQALNSAYWQVMPTLSALTPEDLMMTEEMMQRLRKAIQDLPPRCRLIFKLVKEDGLRYKEVADLLEVSIKTIEAQMAIALRRLSACMQLDIPTHFHRQPKK